MRCHQMERGPRLVVVMLAWLFPGLIVAHLMSLPARAEFYVAGALGPQLANNFGEVRTTGTTPGNNLTDLNLTKSLVGNLKAGFYFPSVPWLGFQVESFYAAPTIKEQASRVTGAVNGSVLFGETDLRVLTIAYNVMVRARLGSFEPYAGVGPALMLYQAKGEGGTTSWGRAPGFNALAGYRSYFTKDKNCALFVEWKYNRARLSFDNVIDPTLGLGRGLKGDYEAHQILVGLSYHFPQ